MLKFFHASWQIFTMIFHITLLSASKSQATKSLPIKDIIDNSLSGCYYSNIIRWYNDDKT